MLHKRGANFDSRIEEHREDARQKPFGSDSVRDDLGGKFAGARVRRDAPSR